MKREYVKPAVESEEALEQTSLQCNTSYLPMYDPCDWGQTTWSEVECVGNDVSKGGVFFIGDGCGQDINVEWDCLVSLS